ncbi:hypothetical protein VZT92_019379 [Zoarces viviparus]|uniref:Uncharacterized protein n=1 Tax=Zoarces viviparus TaxID=48416 RepID=A0AAW1EKB7_ZOAVI
MEGEGWRTTGPDGERRSPFFQWAEAGLLCAFGSLVGQLRVDVFQPSSQEDPEPPLNHSQHPRESETQ